MAVDTYEESVQLAELVKKSVLGVFVNDRDLFLEFLDEGSVLIGAGSKVFQGRSEFAKWPLNPPGIEARNVMFYPLYTNRPDEVTVVGTYLLSGPCIHGTVNQRVTTSLKKVDGKWIVRLSHFSNEWPMGMPGTSSQSAAEPPAPKRLQLRTEDGLAFVNPDDIVYAESNGKRCVLHFRDRTLPVNLLLRELCDQLPDQFVRTSRFYVVNVLYVQGVGKDGIVFSTGEKLSVPERRIKEIQVEIGSAVTRALR